LTKSEIISRLVIEILFLKNWIRTGNY